MVKNQKNPCVYIILCKGGTLYTGWTNDFKKRLAAHNSGRGAKYTRSRAPIEPVYLEYFSDRILAMRREAAIKKLTHEKKLQLIKSDKNQVAKFLFRQKGKETNEMIRKITDAILYIGADNRELDLFEGQYIVPNGVAYNSYMVFDKKIAVIDTIDKSKTHEWLCNVEEALGGREPDYLIIQHMEPDHSASIMDFMEKYSETTVVGNKKTFNMIDRFFPGMSIKNILEVQSGDTLELGQRSLSFLFAPMVHWPEVMMTYDSADKVLFSADAFGKFGALDPCEDWTCEARRYYFGIVGKFGQQVQNLLKKAEALDIKTICPLHGPVLTENLNYYFDLYDKWSAYEPETEGICICYTSVYGNTKKAVEALRDELVTRGAPKVVLNDLARCDMAEAVEDAFRYDRLVLATTTYNGNIFPFMKNFIQELTERNYQNRRVALIENGTWAPMAVKVMKSMLEKSKNISYAENSITIPSAVTAANFEQIKTLAEELLTTPVKTASVDGLCTR